LLRALCSITSVFTPDGTVAVSGAAMADTEAITARTEHSTEIRMFFPPNKPECLQRTRRRLFRIANLRAIWQPAFAA
jgi:hypothetical protein